MKMVRANGLELCVETIGASDDPALVMVGGFGTQIVSWDRRFYELLAAEGFHVVVFDHRDAGRSTRFDGMADNLDAIMTAALLGEPAPSEVPYRIGDFSRDVLGLMDGLGIDRAHLVGASMGGMVAQQVAIDAPNRVRSLVSWMSTTGEPEVSQPSPEMMGELLRPPSVDLADHIAGSLSWAKLCGSKRYFSEDAVTRRVEREFARGMYPEGARRHLAAVLASGHRVAGLSQLDVPTLVIHGRDDTLLPPAAGVRTAEVIPGARLCMISDLGHDLPEPLWPRLVAEIARHCSQD